MDLREKIQEKLAQIKSIELAKIHLELIEDSLEEEESKLNDLLEKLDRSIFDIKELENLKLRKLFSTVLVDKETQLEEQRQKYLQLYLEIKEAKKQIDLANFEKEILTKKVRYEKNLKKELATLLEYREREILTTDNPLKKEIVKVHVKIDLKVQINREIYEALIAGTKVKNHMTILLNYLEKAAKLRHFTFELSQTNMIPKEKQFVDLALQEFYKLKPSLIIYEKELRDVFKNRQLMLSSKLERFKTFSKVYYNNLINDWVIYERVNQTLKLMKEVEQVILESIESLELLKLANNDDIMSLERLKAKMLEA